MSRVTVSHRDTPVQAFSLNDAEMKSLVRDLHRPDPRLYWSDLLLTSATGWIALAIAVASRPLSPVMFVAAILAVCALYRGLCFMHEITHQSPKALAGFETAWNWLIGFPLLMPTFVYVGVHQSHHRIGTYGTDQDPEYMPFARSSRMTARFRSGELLHSSRANRTLSFSGTDRLIAAALAPAGWSSTRPR